MVLAKTAHLKAHQAAKMNCSLPCAKFTGTNNKFEDIEMSGARSRVICMGMRLVGRVTLRAIPFPLHVQRNDNNNAAIHT